MIGQVSGWAARFPYLQHEEMKLAAGPPLRLLTLFGQRASKCCRIIGHQVREDVGKTITPRTIPNISMARAILALFKAHVVS
ncbi:hypothetical protein [Sphingopyxis sp. OAS728]|uniref:hypothetical protein n=1 Tax=Sphingopyxis sp. OAS728 TaxID=2663823 RepID=UPI001CEF019B|nr:hypothetical protein [Sphingopyxis sp. OAS728]